MIISYTDWDCVVTVDYLLFIQRHVYSASLLTRTENTIHLSSFDP
jgi:hypothetical protein